MTDPLPEIEMLRSDIRDLLIRRSERIRKPLPDSDVESDALWVAIFALGDQNYALVLSTLRAALPLRSITPVPRSSRAVVGILQFEGQVIAALSTAALLGGTWHVAPTILLVVDAGGGRTVALDCGQVPIATTMSHSRYRDAALTARGAIASVDVPGRGAVHVIDLSRLLDAQDWRGR